MYLQKQETEYDVKMTEEDRLFKEDQVSGERKMYCESFADKRWLATEERRRKEEDRQTIAREKDTRDQGALFTKVAIPDEEENEKLQELEDMETSFEVAIENEEVQHRASKREKKW